MPRCRHDIGRRAGGCDLQWHLCRVHQHVHRGEYANRLVLVRLHDSPVGLGAARVLILIRDKASAVEWLQRWHQRWKLCTHVLVCHAAAIATVTIAAATFTIASTAVAAVAVAPTSINPASTPPAITAAPCAAAVPTPASVVTTFVAPVPTTST